MRTQCTLPDCSELAVARGFCDSHWHKWRAKNPGPLPPKPRSINRPACSIPGCDVIATGLGHCRRHWMALDYLPSRPACAIDGCAAPAVKRGWCAGHYSNWRRHGDPIWRHDYDRPGFVPATERPNHACAQCGAAFYDSHAEAKYCSRTCMAAAWRVEKGPCTVNGCEKPQVACGLCSAHYYHMTMAGPRPRCATEGCERPARSKGLCNTCYVRVCRRNPPPPRPVRLPGEAKRQAAHRYNAGKRGSFVEHVEERVVWERDGGRCQICGGAVPQDAISLDHILPVSYGGEYSYRNLRLAHVGCNKGRQHRGSAQLRLLG